MYSYFKEWLLSLVTSEDDNGFNTNKRMTERRPERKMVASRAKPRHNCIWNSEYESFFLFAAIAERYVSCMCYVFIQTRCREIQNHC